MAENSGANATFKARFQNPFRTVGNFLNGPQDGPENPGRRKFLKTAAYAGVGAVCAAAGLAELKLLSTAANVLVLTHNLPETRNRSSEHIQAEYGNLNDIPLVVEDLGNGPIKKRPVGIAVFGDSLAFGFIEDYDKSLRMTPTQLCPTDIFCKDFTDANVRDMEDTQIFFEDLIQAKPGAEIKDIEKQIEDFALLSQESPETIPYDFVFAVGGNNALNWLGKHVNFPGALDLPNDFQNQFLPNFEKSIKALLEKIVALREMSGTIGDVQHIFVTGVPDIGKSRYLYIDNGIKAPAQQVDMRLPGLQGTASAICTRMNAALLNAVDEVQKKHPDMPIIFEDIFDVPVHGIHPTAQGYQMIAKRREERCRGTFGRVGQSADPNQQYGASTFRDAIAYAGVTSTLEPIPLE